MCFDDDDNDDFEFFTDDEETEKQREKAKAWFDNYDRCGSFNPDESILLYGCELTATDIQLANVFLARFKSLESACNVLKASNALRNVIGQGNTTKDPETTRWNMAYKPGQVVQFWPDGRNGETYLSETTSPAFDTPTGPCVMVADHVVAVLLCNVEPRKTTSPEVSR